MQSGVLQTWITPQSPAIVMQYDRVLRVALDQLIMMSLAKQLIAPQIRFIWWWKLKNLAQMCILRTTYITDINDIVIWKRP